MMFSYDKKWEHQFCTNFIWKQNCCHGSCTMSAILHLVWCILQVPSLKSTALIFLKIFYILLFVFLWNHWWRHQFLNKNLNISRMRGNISKTRAPFFFCSKGLPNKLIYFLLHRHLKVFAIAFVPSDMKERKKKTPLCTKAPDVRFHTISLFLILFLLLSSSSSSSCSSFSFSSKIKFSSFKIKFRATRGGYF